MKVALLSAGKDRPYALGMAEALLSKGIQIDFIGNSELQNEAVFSNKLATYYNLRGDQDPKASIASKIFRVSRYYAKLIMYASSTETRIFHILWLNKFLFLDSTLLNIYYKIRNKKLVYTAHNINMKKRDGGDSFINKITLKFLYNCVDHIFVHSDIMKDELKKEFEISESKITAIPFGLNSTNLDSELDPCKAKELLNLRKNDVTLLFFGNIAPYKGLDILIDALETVVQKKYEVKLIIAGSIKYSEEDWNLIEKRITEYGLEKCVIKRIEYIHDDEVEIYFKAADVLVLPYRFIYQSGPLFLAYNFGLPVIATDVGSFRKDIIEGETGYVADGVEADDFAESIIKYINSELYRDLNNRRTKIKQIAKEKYSWDRIADKIISVYDKLS
jgi:glycosyltransferase involved in cell wall biosynthesis